ncbi:serine/threonine-protein kinase [Floridanema aerugineum]|uniref:Serine/threonine-protein kinase n=1 Tax=Floridaenema aerugineum BLCC-F46 TaxID=3153654 RepID=A0ABV4X6W7_9CYAN
MPNLISLNAFSNYSNMSYWVSGKTLHNGEYTIEKLLGEGGFGITYQARDKTGQKVVIKTLNNQVQRRPDFDTFQRRFIDEAEKLKKCQHNNIVKFYNLIQEGQLWCIVMEYIDGENLATIVMREGVLREADALNYVQQIGNALTVTHKQRILHRDVKPKNIILRRNKSEVVLIDFGIAREFNPNQMNSHTQFVSDGYAPIEQYFRRHKPGDYTDVYALAATLYVLLTGYLQKGKILCDRLPRAIDRDDNLKNSKPDPLVAPNKINPNISSRVNNAILSGMAIQPDQRPQTVQKWLKLLQPNSNLSQMATLHIPGIKPIYHNAVTNFTKINNQSSLLPVGAVFFFILIIYIYFPHLSFNPLSRPSQPPSYQSDPTESPSKRAKFREDSPIQEISINPVQIDYSLLEKLLASQKFRDADNETLQIMLLLVNRQKKAWFDIEDINNIPCSDLRKINKLWIKYSNGRFGFSVQKNEWIEVGGKRGIHNVKIANNFGSRVGWYMNNKWYHNIIYKLSAPSGHLPFKVTSRVWEFGPPHIAKRLESCNID